MAITFAITCNLNYVLIMLQFYYVEERQSLWKLIPTMMVLLNLSNSSKNVVQCSRVTCIVAFLALYKDFSIFTPNHYHYPLHNVCHHL